MLLFRPFLNANKRELLSDYALPVAVIIMSFVGSYIFREVVCKYATPSSPTLSPPAGHGALLPGHALGLLSAVWTVTLWH